MSIRQIPKSILEKIRNGQPYHVRIRSITPWFEDDIKIEFEFMDGPLIDWVFTQEMTVIDK